MLTSARQVKNNSSKGLGRTVASLVQLGIAFALAGLIIGIGSPAFAYSLEGGRWILQPYSGCCLQLNVQYASSMYTVERTGWDNGRQAWNSSSANALLYTGSSNLTVNDVYESTVSWDGLTNYNIDGSGYFTYANAYLNYYYTSGDSSATIQGVAAHELGHALGLGHTGGCVLMTPDTNTRRSCGITGPVADDDNGINALY